MILNGTISIVGDAATSLPVEIEAEGDRLVVRTVDGGVLGDWRLVDLTARRHGHSFLIEADGEQMVLASTASDELAQALRSRLSEPSAALLNCSVCGHDVSSAAQSCPNCGHPVNVTGADLVRALQDRQPSEPHVGAPTGKAMQGNQTPWAWATLAAGIGLIVGSFLPWVTATAVLIGTVSVSGMSGDGIFTLATGGVVALVGALALARGVRTSGLVAAFVALAIAGVVAGIDFYNVSEGVAEANTSSFGFASVGIGLWLIMASVVVGLIGASGLIDKRNR